jgi:hypothetical protein
VSQGVKELLLEVPIFKGNPTMMLLVGVLVLTATGTLYKKLDK